MAGLPAMSYNPNFKQPSAYPLHRLASPPPPRDWIEPLSPVKPTPLEPHFNYPAIDVSAYAPPPEGAFAATPRARAATTSLVTSHKHGHYRTSSTIDTLAEAALAISPTFASPLRQPAAQNGQAKGHTHAHPSYHTSSAIEPPHKRARSELLPSPHTGQTASRPATSYDGWSAHQSASGGYGYDSRVEEAALLLNFRTGGWPARSPALPPPPVPSTLRPHANSFPQSERRQAGDVAAKAPLLPPFIPQINKLLPPTLSLPEQNNERTSVINQRPTESVDEDAVMADAVVVDADLALPFQLDGAGVTAPNQMQQTLREFESRPRSNDTVMIEGSNATNNRHGSSKVKRRAVSVKKHAVEKTITKRGAGRRKTPDNTKPGSGVAKKEAVGWMENNNMKITRRKSLSDIEVSGRQIANVGVKVVSRSESVPREVPMTVRAVSPTKGARAKTKVTIEPICAGCNSSRVSATQAGELDEWISCNGCKKWFHIDCAGFKKASEVKDVDKYFCTLCESVHGKTTYVRKSSRAHVSVDYAELQRGVLKTSEESVEHHYIQPIKDRTFKFDPESFPRMRPELVTKEFFERSNTFTEPICIPAEWNPRPWEVRRRKSKEVAEDEDVETKDADVSDELAEEFEYDSVPDDGQDKLDMVMPEGLTVRQVCNLVGPDTPLDVIDVKTQNSGSKWTLSKWADYYEQEGEDKAIRNVISLEVSQTKLGRLLRRPKFVRDIDLQDSVWPKEEFDKGKFPKVQFYCLMSIADSYTDFHIDFGGSSVYYHILKGKKTFFFISPKAKHLKAYEEWNESPQQNFTFLPSKTKECYRVDLSEGDTMLIPAGWIHAVWTPETSLVIGGNFLTRMTYKNQFKVVEIEKNNETPQKFRYPHFQRIMWYTAIQYLKSDPLPQEVSELFYEGLQFQREQPIWADYEGTIAENDPRPGAHNARYYSLAEVDGLPDVVNFIFRTVMLVMGRVEGISADKMKRVNASIPKGFGEPLALAKTFALWVAWKRGNEDPPAWAHPDAILPLNSKEEGAAPKKLSARALKVMERKEAIAAYRVAPDRQSARQLSKMVKDAVAAPPPPPNNDSVSPISVAVLDRESPPSSNAPPPIHQTPSHMHNGHHFPAPPVAPPAAFTVNSLTAAYMSTPKTSVLGPKRVACDTCRKRRIRCKHKDMVLQVTTPTSNGQHSQPLLLPVDGLFYSNSNPDLHDNITITPPKPREHANFFATVMDGRQDGDAMPNGAMADYAHFTDGETQHDGQGPLPGTNAYVNANIPMAMNGVPIFGDAQKRGRTKACYECRKSKRRCIHDETGNVDPVKAAETPVPRGSAVGKNREHSDNSSPNPTKKKPKQEVVGGLRGVLHPLPSHQSNPSTHQTNPIIRTPSAAPHNLPQYPNGPQHRPQMATSSSSARHSPAHQDRQQPPIDPSLFSMYPEPSDSIPYSAHNHPYPTTERPPLYNMPLPSLEQIANEVLDMNGRGHEDFHDSGLAQVEQFNQQHHHVYGAQDMAPSLVGEGMAKQGQSVDSAVSLPTTEMLEQTVPQQVSVEERLRAHLSGEEGSARAMETSSATVVHHELPLASTPNHEQPQTSPSTTKSAISNIPLYQPPAPLARSPEVAKRPIPNGVAHTAAASSMPSMSPEATHKRKRDSTSATPGDSTAVKRIRQTSGEPSTPAVEESEDARFARLLQQEDLGLRKRG